MTTKTSIEKNMTLSASEFAKSLAAFAGADVVIVGGRATIPLGHDGYMAEIIYHPLPLRRVGGLLELPQARISIILPSVATAIQSDFLRRFDIAFQRGGG
ncbi:MAG: hypothetical protein ACK5KM_13895 [Hyphomicrobiaceae bacterium]